MRSASLHPGRPPSPHVRDARHDESAARLAALMAREHLSAPVIGVMMDCGARGDAQAVRDEVLIAGPDGHALLACFRPVASCVPEGAADPWQRALAILDDAFEGDAPLDSLPLFAAIPVETIAAARAARRPSEGASTLAVRHYSEALELLGWWRDPQPAGPPAGWQSRVAGPLAADLDHRRYRYEVSRVSQPWELDLRPAVRDAVFELIGGERPARVVARFLNTVAAAAADLVRGAACLHGRVPVVLAGTCFAAAGLGARMQRELAGDFRVVYEHGGAATP